MSAKDDQSGISRVPGGRVGPLLNSLKNIPIPDAWLPVKGGFCGIYIVPRKLMQRTYYHKKTLILKT